MADVLFYEDSIIFDRDDPDFDNSALHPDYEDKESEADCRDGNEKDSVSRHSFTTDCLPTMSYGMIDSPAFDYPSNSWLLRGESVESLDCSRLNAMDCRVDPNYHGHVNETSMSIEDIRSHFNSCNSCGVSWSDNHVSLDCSECGGYSLKRPCPLCDGKCKAIWTRDVSMSHSVGKAHWDGECRLPQEESQSSIPSFLAEDVLIQGIQELSASS